MILHHAFMPLDNTRLARLCGSMDAHLREIEGALDVVVRRRNGSFRIEGEKQAAERAAAVLQSLYDRAGRPLAAETVQLALVEALAEPSPPVRRRANRRLLPVDAGADETAAASNDAVQHREDADAGAGGGVGAGAHRSERDRRAQPSAVGAGAAGGTGAGGAVGGVGNLEPPVLRTRRSELVARTPNQHVYLDNILGHDITFGIGPAGTGKTFLAVACAVDALERSAVQRIILTRPAVEAGERLGFLPGDLAQKVDPYLRPLYDALYDLMGAEKVAKAFEKGAIEVAPLAFMRGRTLNHAFVILDEAQNTTIEQMKMFLTRIGFGSRCVVTGDVSQIDLGPGQVSGLVDAERVLRRVPGIAHTHFTAADVVRHPLVARIVEAYDAARPTAV